LSAIENLLSGVVADTEGAVVPNATVLVHWDSAGSAVGLESNVGVKQDVTVNSLELPPGFYDVFVSATAFSPFAQKVRIKLHAPVTLNPRLQIDPLVTRELGDRFPVR
jgi:hypothetical protein